MNNSAYPRIAQDKTGHPISSRESTVTILGVMILCDFVQVSHPEKSMSFGLHNLTWEDTSPSFGTQEFGGYDHETLQMEPQIPN